MPSQDTPVTALVGLRMAIGVGAWVAPRLTGRLFGLHIDGNTEAVLMARLFGVRDVALGFATLQTSGPARKTVLQAGIACDLLDAAAAVLAARGGGITKVTAAMIATTAIAAAGTGALAVQQA